MARKVNKDGLTDKEYTFVMEYLKDNNGARAARACGYVPNNPQNSRQAAQEILTKPYVKKFIAQHKADLAEKVAIDENDILRLCKEIMQAKPSDYYDKDLLDIAIDEDSPNQRAIQSLTVCTKLDKEGNIDFRTEKITLRDPLKAAERVAKLLGLDEQGDDMKDREITVNINYTGNDNEGK